MATETLAMLMRVNLSMGAAILLVLALRLMMRRWFGARAAYALWWVTPITIAAAMLPARVVELKSVIVNAVANAATPTSLGAWMDRPISMNVPVDLPSLVAAAWIMGAVTMLVVLALRQRAFVGSLGRLSTEPNDRRTLRAEASGIGPAIMGAIFPKLVLPKDFEARFNKDERNMVLAHEHVHLRGFHPQVNTLVALTQCLCWFNPLVHIGAYVLRIDQELACDAAVVALYPRARRLYAEAMLKAQLTLPLPLGCYWPAHPLTLRITVLKRPLPTAKRVAAGVIVAMCTVLTTGCAAWAAQPPRVVVVSDDTIRFASVAQRSRSLNADLIRSALEGNLYEAKTLVANGADVNARMTNGLTPLIIAARTEDRAMARFLLDHGADTELVAPSEGNALTAASKRGHLHIVVDLLERGAQVNAQVSGVGTPLIVAVRSDHPEVVEHLVEHGADVNLSASLPAPWDRVSSIKRTPLEVAVKAGHIWTGTYLRSMGATM